MLPHWLVIVEENGQKKGQWEPFCCLLPSPAVTDFSLFVWQWHLFYELSPRPVTNRWPVPHSKVICFAQQQLWVTPAKLHLVFQYYNPSQRQRQWKNAEKKAGGREGRKKNNLLRSNKCHCKHKWQVSFGVVPAQGLKGQHCLISSAMSASKVGGLEREGEMSDWCHSQEWEQANYISYPSREGQSEASAISPLLTSQDTSHR